MIALWLLMRRGWGAGSITAGAGILFGSTVLLFSAASPETALTERVLRHRTLGKAFYENPTTQNEAVAQLQQVLKLQPGSVTDRLNYGLALLRAAKTKEGIAELEAVQKAEPGLPHTWFNLGIELKKLGETERAIAQLEQMAKLVPDEPITQYNLGVLYKQTSRLEDATRQFERAASLDQNLAAPHFQLFNVYRQAGRRDEAQKELKRFQEIKAGLEASGNSEDVEWSVYSELYEVIDPKTSAAAGPATPASLQFSGILLPGKANPSNASLTVLDADRDGTSDLLVASESGLLLYRSGLTPVATSGLGDVRGVISVTSGDFDNDGLVEVCVLTRSGPALYRNTKGRFTKAEAGLPAQEFGAAAWLDYDHDYDLDLVLFGKRSFLFRNQGQAGFTDRTDDFPFVAGTAVSAANIRLVPDSKALDLLVSYKDRPGVVYRDRLGGRYEAVDANAIPAGAAKLRATDWNNDSFLDVVYSSGNQIVLVANRKGILERAGSAFPGSAFALGDFDHRGYTDVIAGASRAANVGEGRFEAAKPVLSLGAGAAWSTADFNGDGKPDLAGVLADGSIKRFINRTPTTNNWLRVGLTGIKNLKLAPGSEVEVKAGLLYQKKVYSGTPLVFGMRGMKQADTVRITWPNGLIQNEMRQLAGRPYVYKEAQRLSGSCPVIWTWNGKQFEYITDVLGVAPLGASSGDGKYFPTDSDEYVSISADSLRVKNGMYEVRITEELSEVSYLDKIELIAVDHPASVEVFSNDKWKSPPFPEFRLFSAQKRVAARTAIDEAGRDVTFLIARKDRRYPDGFPQNLNGVAAMHNLDLDFGTAAKDNRAVLILHGWVDWADGSTFLAQAQESKTGLVTPYLQVKDKSGKWVTVIEDMGMPAGKPKTIAVDLTGKFLSESREIRIVTNLCVFWDEIFLSENSVAPEVRLTVLAPSATDLRFRGFSETLIHPERKQPEQFFYAEPAASSLWNPTPGIYTRYGKVTELLKATDDRLVVLGSGDEVQLMYKAADLPSLPEGWRRDWLLKVDGWAKDRDANTAHSQTVEPLPFRDMSSYPYPRNEQYPNDSYHSKYREEYNTRPALRLLRPLHVSGTQSIRVN